MAQPGTFVDLLTEPAQENAEDKLYELANTISNIVSSYDDPYDAFAELVQNALDAVAARAATDDHFTPRVTVAIDLAARTLAVEDNGTGIRWDDHRPAVRPNYSLKRRLGQRSSRGEKGAALTFLQFGHSMFELTTRAAGEFGWTYRLHDGKSWYERTAAHLEDPSGSGSYEQPTFDLTQHGTGDVAEQGTIASVTFPDDRLVDLIGEDLTCAGDRIEYLLRTRRASVQSPPPTIDATDLGGDRDMGV